MLILVVNIVIGGKAVSFFPRCYIRYISHQEFVLIPCIVCRNVLWKRWKNTPKVELRYAGLGNGNIITTADFADFHGMLEMVNTDIAYAL